MMYKVCSNRSFLRARLWLLSLVLLLPIRMMGAGFTPTEGGLVVNLEPGDRFLLSTMVDGQEYFVCHYPGYTGGYFSYTNWDVDVEAPQGKGNILKLIPQAANATEPSQVSIWTIDDAKPLLYNNTPYTLDGIAYTMWSTNPGGDSYTLLTAFDNSYQYIGNLTRKTDDNNICNVIFVAPTNRSTVTSFDPNKTITATYGRTQDSQGRFNGEKGFGFLGLPYREVYWLDIPRSNSNPASYANASLICFNTIQKEVKYPTDKKVTARPGQAMYAFADNKHKPTKRTIFRLYLLDEDYTSSCPDTYFFAFDKQDYVRYRNFDKNTYTSWRKIYTIDHFVCMENIPGTTKYQTSLMNVPTDDSTYYYVGHNNEYCHGTLGANNADSQFKKIRLLPIDGLTGFRAPAGAYGRMIVDTTSTAQNLDVAFKPEGFFLRTNTGRNIRMKQTGEYEWTCEEMWHITTEYAALQIKATMFSGSEFSDLDEGRDIPGWSVMVTGTSVPLASDHSQYVRGGMDGWARIHTNRTEENGYLEFIPADPDRHIHYDNNGLVGSQIPDQYPVYGKTKVCVEEPRLAGGFDFAGWTTNADGTGTLYHPGDSIALPTGELTLYAKATFTGTIHVAFSFVQDGQRYYLTQPGLNGFRVAHARPTTDWTDTYQGMADVENSEPNYISTYQLLSGPDPCKECAAGEVVLDPRQEMRHGAIDSLLFYEVHPSEEEYVGLYYTDPNVIVANDTWAGLFTSTAGWPNYSNADVQNAKLRSTHYLHRVNGDITRAERSNSSASWVKYNSATDQFDGVSSEDDATVFQIARVRVADEHYVVIPDTTEEWINEITFGYHQDDQTSERVWSKLIGKQLMAVTKVGEDTVYFHPNPDKIVTDATQLRLSSNYRLEEVFELIHDARVSTVAEEDRTHMSDRLDRNYFGRLITSGLSSPMNAQDAGSNYIDIVDTLRISLVTRGPMKIKDYYGRWKDGAPGLHIRPDGSRYRDILVTTKTYHYGATQTRLVLRPEYEDYIFNPFAGTSKTINFILTKERVRQLVDVDGNPIGEVEILSSEDVTSSLALGPGACSFSAGGTYFAINNEQTVSQHATLYTRSENSSEGENEDTLIVSTTVTIDGVPYPATTRVPLLQTTAYFDELIWSATAGSTRYYIMANSSGLIFHEYTLRNNTLYKKGTSTQLKVGAASTTTDEYITPWKFTYVSGHPDQLTLNTEYGVDKNFVINGSTGEASTASPTVLTYRYETIYRNANGNEEEMVRLKYGPNQWLKFQVEDGVPSITLQSDSATATVFSWGYMDREYYLTNNGDYPDKENLEFFYNRTSTGTIQTRYKAYRHYSMLIGNKLTYLCREDENDIADLINSSGDWKTSYNITRIRDGRSFDGGTKLSGLTVSTDAITLTTSVTPEGDSPMDVKIGGKYVNIVDTLEVQVSLQNNAPEYRFSGGWSSYSSVDDAHLKLPLIRRTYHEAPFDSLVCVVENDEYNYAFSPRIVEGSNDEHTFVFGTELRTGRHVLDVYNEPVSFIETDEEDVTGGMDLTDPALAEVRLVDGHGNSPSWCRIEGKTANTITVKALQDGIRSPRLAYIYMAYMVDVGGGTMRFVSFRLTISQASLFTYANNQRLVHTTGASGDEVQANGMQKVHTNRQKLYYYNPSNINHSPDQKVELPVRERAFYGWWRWYRESDDPEIGDSDIPDSLWVNPPQNVGKNNTNLMPYRTIGDSVWINEENHALGKKLVTMGRYTVFHYPAKAYGDKKDPPAKNPTVCPPVDKATVVYAVDISNYYDNLPLSMNPVNQTDTAMLDTMTIITEPTLSLREVFELHPWTEMADTMEHYKYADATADGRNSHMEKYMEDHVVMAPTGNRLLLSTEQRYNKKNLSDHGHSESLLGYYMRDDNWSTAGWDAARKDTMIWCGGWDADCKWYTYDPQKGTYAACTHTVMAETDFLQVPALSNITTGHEFDTVYYYLRARSIKTTTAGTALDPDPETPAAGDNWFNICRYMIVYHWANKYGPKEEIRGTALITNDEIEQKYEVLERLDFDYNKPGSDYTIYPHPLPWGDASYGYTYPLSSTLPVNRFHDQQDFPNHGEYGIINRIPYNQYWRLMQQHGGAENGYMIYCDGMASAGQVAALTLNTNLCAGQKMFFSGYVGNPSSQTGKSDPNFIISVQGSENGTDWDDITSYMTGDIKPSNNWYQVYFPINHNNGNKSYTHFRVRIYNVAANFDGNDFVIDDMCIFATKPPLIAYQANTACKEKGEEEEPSHVILRVDYQGITGEGYNNASVYYTVKRVTPSRETSFVDMVDGYLNRELHHDTICGRLYIPAREYVPTDPDSMFVNLAQLIDSFDVSNGVFKEGYIHEILEGETRPVKYVIHKALLNPTDTFTVHMSSDYGELLSSICGMTSHLDVSSQMVLELNGEEQPDTEQFGLCANSTYNIGLRVKGSLYQDNAAPVDLNGSCINDWLLYGDTAEVSSEARYGYKYSDIVKVVKDILRCVPAGTTNANQSAPNLAAVSRNEMQRIMDSELVDLDTDDHPYDVLAHLVNSGFLELYQANVTATVYSGDSVQYVIFPILGTGNDAMNDASVEVCPVPIFIKLKPAAGSGAPLVIGGQHRSASEMNQPLVVLADASMAGQEIKVKVDSIMPMVGIYSVELRMTDDPDYREGVHLLAFEPDRAYPGNDYYVKGDTITFSPASTNTYTMKPGYSYEYDIVMQTATGSLTIDPTDPNSCRVGTVPFTVSIVPDYLRWDPQDSESNQWNKPGNWIGINEANQPIHTNARFAPLNSTVVIIPTLDDGMPYPELPDLATPSAYDSVKQVGFSYNTCDYIRFMPGAAIGQQQRLNYTKAIVDMSTPQAKWALRSAPVTGLLSGDIFMSNADLNGESKPWEVGEFDASGRSYTTGNASFWLSVYSKTVVQYGNGTSVQNDTTASAAWSKVTNGMTLSLPPAQGFAVYTWTRSGNNAAVRLPKNDDIYYYFYRNGDKIYDKYEQNLRSLRNTNAGGQAGKLAFHPAGSSESYTLSNDSSSTSFVFGNPTMGYIDIWGFVTDNSLVGEISYIDASGGWTTVSRSTAEASSNVITNQSRYLPPMHAIVVKTSSASTSKTVTLNTNRIVTAAVCPPLSPAPRRAKEVSLPKGIMTVTAMNPVSPQCTSRLLIGQGYNDAILSGEDAVLSTVNINNYSQTSAPATPFNIYAAEDGYGLSIDLRDSVVNIPISFYMSDLPFSPVTNLWFTGVNNIDGPLVFYDALMDSELPIMDGICLNIETPESSHQTRYYIRRYGFKPDDGNQGIATGFETVGNSEDQAMKIIRNGHVLILRNGHVYTMYGQLVR